MKSGVLQPAARARSVHMTIQRFTHLPCMAPCGCVQDSCTLGGGNLRPIDYRVLHGQRCQQASGKGLRSLETG